MQPLRSGRFGPVSLALLAIVLMGCTAVGSAARQSSAGADTSSALTVAEPTDVNEAVAGVTDVLETPSPTPKLAVDACAIGQLNGMRQYQVGGFEAQRYCGPATASVTLGTKTVKVVGGFCRDNNVGFGVSVGTKLAGIPRADQEPDLLVITVDPKSGRGSIGGIVGHVHWLLNGHPVVFGTGRLSGTFKGISAFSGAVAKGSFTC